MSLILESVDLPEPDDLTVFVRQVPPSDGIRLVNEFPTKTTEDNTVSWAEVLRHNRTARYRSFDGRVHVSQRDGGSEKRVPLIPLSTSLNTGELELLQLQFARFGGTRSQALSEAVYDDAELLTREVLNRLEQAWGDVLTDGKLTIAENGLTAEADYGLPNAHKIIASTSWFDPTANVLTAILACNQVYREANGSGAGRILTSQSVINVVRRNPEVIAAVHGTQAGRTQVSLAEINQLLADEGAPTFEPAYDAKVDIDNTPTRVLAENRVTFLPQDLSLLGHTAYGVTATALELVNSDKVDLDFEKAPGIVGVVVKSDGVPVREYVYVDAVAMPVLTDARRLMAIQV